MSATPAADRVQAKIDALIERACRMVVLELDKELRRRGSGTPVDTGHARANWIPSVTTPAMVEVAGTSDAAHSAGVAQVLAYKLGQGTLYVSNNVPYIRRLNDGWSEKAPALFIESCIDRAIVTVKRKLGVDMGRSQFQSSVGASGAENMASAYSPFGDD